MGLFITTRTTVNRHGVFAEERSVPLAVTPIGTGTVGMVAQLPWGPDNQIIVPTDPADRLLTIAPPGMDHTGSGYMCQLNKAWPDLRIARVLGSAAAVAVAPLLNATPATCVNVNAKWKGTAGNAMTGVVSAATDGNANHFDLTVSVTGASGTTTELFVNINFSGTGADSVVDCTRSRLVGSIAKVLTGRPVNGTYNFASGADGSITSARYLGTAGNGDLGLALFEGDPDIDIVFTDDPSSGLRVAVNAGLQAHQLLLGDRIACLNGDSGIANPATVQAAAAINQSTGIAWVDCWAYQHDDIDGTERLVAPACAMACVMSNFPPSTSPAWKGQEVRNFLSWISRLEFARGAAAGSNTAAGVCTLIKEAKGGYTFEAAVNTAAPVSPVKKRLTRTRMGIYIAKSITESLREMVDAPNVTVVQNDCIKAVASFLAGLKDNVKVDPLHQVHIVDWQFLDLSSLNPTADIANGDFTIPVAVTTSAGMERIFLSIAYGETVTVTAA